MQIDIYNTFIQVDQYCDCIPLVSTATNVVNIFSKCMLELCISDKTHLKNRYLVYLNKKSFTKCFILLIPIVGNIFAIGGEHSQKVKAPPIVSNYGSKDCVNLSPSTAVSRFNEEIISFKSHFKGTPFEHLPENLTAFLWAEKTKLFLTAGKRHIEKNGEIVGGYTAHFLYPEDGPFHPKELKPFEIKGFWIPEEEGEFFSIDKNPNSPLVRYKSNGKREVLFLIHPQSEPLYSPLIKKYQIKQESISALALSSFRSLLIAIPDKKNAKPNYAMVKVSLDEDIGNVRRILCLKECGGSIANTMILNQIATDIAFMNEDYSFVPQDSLLNGEPEFSKSKEKRAGMIHRSIPDFLLSSSTASRELVIPLFALTGTKNRPLLDCLIKQSNKTPTEFIKDAILRPIAKNFIYLLYHHEIALEIHGQNLLLKISGLDTQLIYRDMGGVNWGTIKPEKLPKKLQKETFFYCDTHLNDTATVLENFVKKWLFPLTQQCIKSPLYSKIDPSLCEWKDEMENQGLTHNWHIESEDPDAHLEIFTTEDSFSRYGYFEKIFGNLLLEEMDHQGIFSRLEEIYSSEIVKNYKQELKAKLDEKNCGNWFFDLIMGTYFQYLKK